MAIGQLLNHDHAFGASHGGKRYHISYIIGVQYVWNIVLASAHPSLRGNSSRTIKKKSERSAFHGAAMVVLGRGLGQDDECIPCPKPWLPSLHHGKRSKRLSRGFRGGESHRACLLIRDMVVLCDRQRVKNLEKPHTYA